MPDWLQTGAAWSWRLLLLAVALYLIARAIGVLYIVVVPCTAALLLTALLQPLTARLRHAGLPQLAATWCTLLIALAVLGGLVLLVTNRVNADYPTLVTETRHTTAQVESWLSGRALPRQERQRPERAEQHPRLPQQAQARSSRAPC